MPAKRRLLPRPCPICGKENGTVQIVIWHNSFRVNCRIGHYDSKKYRKPSTPKEKRRRGKTWCYFLIDESFAREKNFLLEQEMDNLYQGNLGKRKSITHTNPSLLLKKIKEEGWHWKGKRYYPDIIKRLGKWEKFLTLHPSLVYEKTYVNFLKKEEPDGSW